MRRKLCAVLAIGSGLVLVAGRAGALPAFYTDGTTFGGDVNNGPPPLDPAFETPCAEAIVDPPATYVFVTLHFVYGTTMPAATVPVHEDAADVVNYHGSAPGTFLVDVSSFVDGKAGFVAYTWNIGTGVTAWVPFDCTTPASSSTTTEPSTTTSLVIEGSTVSSSTSTSTSTSTTSTSTPTVTAAGSTSTPTTSVVVPTGTEQLPFTGSATGPLAFAAVVLSPSAD